MTHTHHTQSFRSTDAFLRHSTPGAGPISEVSWGSLLHPSGLSFGFQARCTGSTRTNKRRRFQKSSVVDWMMPESEEWIRRKRRRRRSIDELASGCMVDLLNLSWAVLCGRQCDFSFFVLVDVGNEQSFVYYGGGGLQHKTPVGADNVDSSMSIWWVYSQSASQHFFGSVVQLGTVKLSRWRHGIPVWSSLIAEKRGADTEWLRRWPPRKSCFLPCNANLHASSASLKHDFSPPYKSEKLAKSCTSVATSAEQAELFRVVREGHPIPESTCWTSPIVIQPVEKRPFWSNGKKHVFLWKLAPAQGKDWAKGYPKLSSILPFSLPVILHLWQHAFLVFGEDFPGRKNKSS